MKNYHAKSYYQMLLEAGIIPLTPQSATCKINEMWHKVMHGGSMNPLRK